MKKFLFIGYAYTIPSGSEDFVNNFLGKFDKILSFS